MISNISISIFSLFPLLTHRRDFSNYESISPEPPYEKGSLDFLTDTKRMFMH